MSASDTISGLLGLLLMGDGLHNNDWGDQTNTNLQTIESAIAGVGTIAGPTGGWAGGTYALSAAQALPKVLIFSGALGANQVVAVPATEKQWLFDNRTTGGFTLTLQAAGGTGIVLGAGVTEAYCDGTNVYGLAIPSTPVGVIEEYYGVELPDNRFVWANGQALSRTAYPALFNALTRVTTATVGNNASVVPCTEDLTGRGIVGSIVEGAGVASGTTVTAVSSSSLTLSKPTTGAQAQQSIRLFPYGNGDGATTFAVPDRREVVAVGNSVMGATASPGRITTNSMPNGANLGNEVGEDRHTTTVAEMPTHGHAVNDNGHAHAITDNGHAHGYNVTNSGNAGATTGGGANQGFTAATTEIAGTGIGIKGAVTGISLQSTGGGQSHNNLQPTIVCNYILRAA